MNTYLSLWTEDRMETMADVIKKTEEVRTTSELRMHGRFFHLCTQWRDCSQVQRSGR